MADRKTEENVEALGALLSDTQLRWIRQMADAQTPAVNATAMLGRLVDDAIAAQKLRQHRRVEQFEVYRASGYPEHHPDYPNLPRRLSDG